MISSMQLPSGLIAILFLVIVQAVLGFLRSFNLIQIGMSLTGEGILFIPLMGFITVARGGLVAIIALLYIAFAVGALMRKSWAWLVGLIAALTNALFVLAVAAGGENVALSLIWGIVPIVLLVYLLLPVGRQALKY
jgi:hypothetical protein